MEAPEHDNSVAVDEVEQEVREPAQKHAPDDSVHGWVALRVALDQIEAGRNGLPESAWDLRTALPIPTLGFGEILFSLRGEANVHSSRSSLARTSSQVLRRGRCRA